MEKLIIQDIAAGLGCCVLDWHGDLVRSVLSHFPLSRPYTDVALWDMTNPAYVFSLHPFHCNPKGEQEVSLTTQLCIEIFQKLFSSDGNLEASAPTMFESVFNTTTLPIYNQDFTLADVPLLLRNEIKTLKLVDNLPATQATCKAWWRDFFTLKEQDKEFRVGSLKRRLIAFSSDPRYSPSRWWIIRTSLPLA